MSFVQGNGHETKKKKNVVQQFRSVQTRQSYCIFEWQAQIKLLNPSCTEQQVLFFNSKCGKRVSISKLQGLCQISMLCQLLLLITINDFLIPQRFSKTLGDLVLHGLNVGKHFCSWLVIVAASKLFSNGETWAGAETCWKSELCPS